MDRAAFYGSRPYAPLRQEFERRLQAIRADGEHPDPRDAQIACLTGQTTRLTKKLAGRDDTIADLIAFKTEALSRLAAQHEELTRLRRADTSNLRLLGDKTTGIDPS